MASASSSCVGCFVLLWLSWWLSWQRICLQCGRPGFDPWVGKILWRRERLPLQYSGLENFMHCLVHGVTELDMTEWLLLLCMTLLRMHVLQPARLLCPWDLPGKNLEWVAISFSRGSSWPRDQTHFSCGSWIGRQIFTTWATWEAPYCFTSLKNVKTTFSCAITDYGPKGYNLSIPPLNKGLKTFFY